jgi:hypothetical protein
MSKIKFIILFQPWISRSNYLIFSFKLILNLYYILIVGLVSIAMTSEILLNKRIYSEEEEDSFSRASSLKITELIEGTKYYKL